MLIQVDRHGNVRRWGIHDPKGTKLIKANLKHIVIKVPSHTVSGGINIGRLYANAEYVIYEIHETRPSDGSNPTEYIATEITSFAVSSKAQQQDLEQFYKINPDLCGGIPV